SAAVGGTPPKARNMGKRSRSAGSPCGRPGTQSRCYRSAQKVPCRLARRGSRRNTKGCRTSNSSRDQILRWGSLRRGRDVSGNKQEGTKRYPGERRIYVRGVNMPTGPAARITDNVVHPLPPVLTPGPGSSNVLIGFLPAWRGIPAAAAAALQAAKQASDIAI